MNFRNWLVLVLTFLYTGISAQIKDPVKLKFDVNPAGNNVYEAVISATLEKGWHIYSKDLPPDSGIPTEMIVTSKEGIELIGGITEVGKKHDEFSEAFGVQIVYFSNNAQFKQKFRFKNPEKPAVISVEFTYQTCDDRVCLAPNTLEFEKKITPVNSGADLENEIVAEEINVQNEVALSPADVVATVQAAPLDPKNLKINSLNNTINSTTFIPIDRLPKPQI